MQYLRRKGVQSVAKMNVIGGAGIVGIGPLDESQSLPLELVIKWFTSEAEGVRTLGEPPRRAESVS
jgi:hypothetical protein